MLIEELFLRIITNKLQSGQIANSVNFYEWNKNNVNLSSGMAIVIQNLIEKIKHNYGVSAVEKPKIKYNEPLFLSLGENCATDNIIARHNLKSYTTAYSWGYTNIDYALQLETVNIDYFLKPNFLYRQDLFNEKGTFSKLIIDCQNIFSWTNGFAFFHIDPLTNPEDTEKIKRRIMRLRDFRENGERDFIFFYNHRFHNNMNLFELIKKLKLFSELYTSLKHKCLIVCLAQEIVSQEYNREVSYFLDGNVYMFVFKTHNIWIGADG